MNYMDIEVEDEMRTISHENKAGLRAYIEEYYHGEIPDFNENDWDELAQEFHEDEYQAFSPDYLVAWQRSNKLFLEVLKRVIRQTKLYVHREADGDFTESNWETACEAAWKEEERLGRYFPTLHRRYLKRNI